MSKNSIVRLVVVSALVVLAASLTSCTIAKISGRGSIPLMLNNPPARVDVISHFNVKKMVTFDYTSAFDVSEIAADKLATANADAVTNLTILIKADFASFCVNLITLGIANARVVVVQGDLVKAPQGLGSLLQDSEILVEADNLEELKLHLSKLDKDGKLTQPTSIVRTETGFAAVAGL